MVTNGKVFASLFVLFFLSFIACIGGNTVKIITIEIMKPGIFIFPDQVDTISIFKRDKFQTDTITYRYSNLQEKLHDSTIQYRDLSNSCMDELSQFLVENGYFLKVINHKDYLNSLIKPSDKIIKPEELLKIAKSDACISLDYFQLNHTFLDFDDKIFFSRASLSWSMNFKSDSTTYIYNQVDTLVFDEDQLSGYDLKNKSPKPIINNAAKYLGRLFGAKIIPSWVTTQRIYYHSENINMLTAEKYALNNDWIKAAEIWAVETKNKNLKIAAKACYNMALACEMNGKPDDSIEWLHLSSSRLKKNEDNRLYCAQYKKVLVLRKKEIELLRKQIRNPQVATSK